jgi:peptidoglycan hydrolase-like protein with peptidoglycan-binding domain
MSKIIKLTERDLNRIVKKVLQEQLTVDDGQNFKTFEKSMMGVNPQPRKFDYKVEDTVVTSLNWGSAATRNPTASYSVAIDSRLPQLVIAPTAKDTAVNSEISRYNTQLLANINKFFKDKGYSIKPTSTVTTVTIDYSKGEKVKNDLNELFKLYPLPSSGVKQPFQWKPSPTEEEVRDGKKLLRYGMRGDFVKKVQETLGFTGKALDGKFGGDTLKAVRQFQTKAKLEDTSGLVGEKTYAAMFRKPVENTQSAQPKGLQSVTPQQPKGDIQRQLPATQSSAEPRSVRPSTKQTQTTPNVVTPPTPQAELQNDDWG